MDHAPDTTAAASNASNYLRAIFHCLICHAPRGDCILGDRCSKVKGTLQALVGDRSQVLAAENAILCEPIQRLLEHWLDCSVGRQEPPCLICSEVYAQLQAPERTQEALLTDTDAITSAFDPTHSTCAPQRSVSAELAGGRGGRSIAALTYMLQTEQPQHTTCNLSSVENGSQLAAGSQAGNTANSGCSSVSCTNSDAAMAEITTCLIQALLTKPEVRYDLGSNAKWRLVKACMPV